VDSTGPGLIEGSCKYCDVSAGTIIAGNFLINE
jgi:hypothetical protein